MTVKRQFFDNGPQGETITAANSADSGDAITTTIDANGKGVYEVGAAMRGAKGAHITGTTADTFQIILSNTSATNGTASVFFRLLSAPTAGGSFFSLRSSTGDICKFYINSSGVLSIQNSIGTGLKNFLSNTALSLNTVYRVALQATPNASTTAGYISGQLYTETGTLLDSFSSGSVNAGTTLDVVSARIGKLQASSDGFDMHFDDLAFDTGTINQITQLPFFACNTAEGGTNGTTVTTGNSGGASGTAFGEVVLGTGTVTYSTEQVHSGAYSIKIVSGSGSAARVRHTVPLAANIFRLSATAYAYLTGYPTAAKQWLYFSNYSSNIANLGMNSAGRPILQDGTATQNTGTSSLPLNTWLRLEVTVIVGATSTTGTIIANIYDGDSYTNLYSYSSSARNTGTDPLSYVVLGNGSNTGDWSTMYIDDFTITDAPLPVPINTALAPWMFA